MEDPSVRTLLKRRVELGDRIVGLPRACNGRDPTMSSGSRVRFRDPTGLPLTITRGRARSCTMCCIQPRYSCRVGRKSREKQERRQRDEHEELDLEPSAVRADEPLTTSEVETVRPPAVARRRPSRPAPVGARVARVAVDDATWDAFRELCGRTPASVRLGQLVDAEVRRARASTPESEALEAVRAIREQAEQVEAFIRARAMTE